MVVDARAQISFKENERARTFRRTAVLEGFAKTQVSREKFKTPTKIIDVGRGGNSCSSGRAGRIFGEEL